MKQIIYKMNPFNFIPLARTPWAGSKISELKKKYLADRGYEIPNRIGESFEVSTDLQYPSFVELLESKEKKLLLTELIAQDPERILGHDILAKHGIHSPLLMKWIEASKPLSVQLHPSSLNPLLAKNECGKPESWLVLNAEEESFVYLGFLSGLSKEQIIHHLLNDEPHKCLYRYYPNRLDYISIPVGCIHAIGAGVFVAEPQYILPQKTGKTWRISDYQRLYNEKGEETPFGSPRELHVSQALEAINWDLPRGYELEKLLVKKLKNEEPFLGDKYNPFAVQVFSNAGIFNYRALQKNTFSLVTVWAGEVLLNSETESICLVAGETAFITSDCGNLVVTLKHKNKEEPAAAFFALNERYV